MFFGPQNNLDLKITLRKWEDKKVNKISCLIEISHFNQFLIGILNKILGQRKGLFQGAEFRDTELNIQISTLNFYIN